MTIQEKIDAIVSRYKETFGTDVEGVVKGGDHQVPLMAGLVVVKEDVALYSTNVSGHPIMTLHEFKMLVDLFGSEGADLTHAHCVNPVTNNIVVGNDESIGELMEMRRQEAKILIEEMVEEAKTNQTESSGPSQAIVGLDGNPVKDNGIILLP